jgi:creatinine amidohydrolase
MDQVRTAEMSWRQVADALERGAAAILPLGSTEEHGPHAATGDYLIAEEVALRAARKSGDLVFPCLPFGYSEYFRKYPGTITLQSETLFRVMQDVVDCLVDQGFEHIVLLNGHKGNEPTLAHFIRKLRREQGLLVPIVSPLGLGLTPDLSRELYGEAGIGHGGEPMGSVWTYLFPGTVDLSLAEDWGSSDFLGLDPSGLGGVKFEGCEVRFAVDMDDITPPSGSLSDPMLASAERGERIVGAAVERLARFMAWFKRVSPRVEPG